MNSAHKQVSKHRSRMQGKGQTPLLLPLAMILLAGIGCYFLISPQNPSSPASAIQDLSMQKSSVTKQAHVLETSAPSSKPYAVQPKSPKASTEQAPSPTPEQQPTYVDMTKKLPANPEDFPDDLRNQLNAPAPELPAEMKAQLAGPPPEIPEDIKRALSIPPRPVTPEEVNTAFTPE